MFDRRPTDFSPKTDLHTHFAGAIKTEKLIEIGIKDHIMYPSSFLEEQGIDSSKYEKNEKGEIDIATLGKKDLKTLRENLEIPITTQETFHKMEDMYRLRGPFTKDPATFEAYLWELAKDYKETGVKYAELSFYSYVGESEKNMQFMQIMEDVLPKIEAETGVKIKFLAAMARSADKEWSLDDVDRITALSKSPYIVGVDFMGHETTETKSRILSAAAAG